MKTCYHVTGYDLDARFADFDTAEAYLWAQGYLRDDAAQGQYVRRWEVSPRMFARTWATLRKER